MEFCLFSNMALGSPQRGHCSQREQLRWKTSDIWAVAVVFAWALSFKAIFLSTQFRFHSWVKYLENSSKNRTRMDAGLAQMGVVGQKPWDGRLYKPRKSQKRTDELMDQSFTTQNNKKDILPFWFGNGNCLKENFFFIFTIPL